MLINSGVIKKEELERCKLRALSLFGQRAIEAGEGGHQRVQVVQINEPNVFNLIFSNFGRRDIKNLRSVCKDMHILFDCSIDEKESPIGQFWERSVVRIQLNDLLPNKDITNKLTFFLQYGLKSMLSLSNQIELSPDWMDPKEFEELCKSLEDSLALGENKDLLAWKLQGIETLEVRERRGIRRINIDRMSNIFRLINLNKISFNNLTELICPFANFLVYDFPTSIEHLTCVGENAGVVICNSMNLRSITLYQVVDSMYSPFFRLENLPNLESLEIRELKRNITLDIQTLPKLTNIKVNEKVILCDRSREKMTIESGIIQAVLPKVS